MRKPRSTMFVPAGAIAVAIALMVIASHPVGAQQKPAAGAKAAALRTADGKPNLNGTWSFSTVTPLQRPKEYGDRAELTAEEIAKLEKTAVDNQFVDRPPPPGNPGAYNRFWIDAGTTLANNRTSLITDPSDGRIPALTPAGKERETRMAAKQAIAAGPEDLTTWDRCLLGFNAGPPIIPSGYNNNLQVVQTADYVVLVTEMVHDARIVPLDGRPKLPSGIRQWHGDSRGRWEGDTLVIETTNFRPEGTGTLPLRGFGLGTDENLRLTERLRRVDADTLEYQFTIDDPTVWTKPWTMSTTMRDTGEPMYEYACHEGNYGMTGILSGARATEKTGAAGAKSGAK